MRPRTGRLDAPDLELHPIALFEMVNASIEGEQELKRMFQ